MMQSEMTGNMMSSHLVETVMINVDDFADNFLTCGTCFSSYNAEERAAKLLPCSHTVCRACLDRILLTQPQSETFRCPICRETISVPTTGGASSFPPAFIVNQLLDLLATQRRDVVPKCRVHPHQELLFCETCDIVFCTECRGRNHTSQVYLVNDSNDLLSDGCGDYRSHNHVVCNDNASGDHVPVTVNENFSNTNSGLNHNVITFNVALKRCSEIMFYKMHLCFQELNGAQQAVTDELERLEHNANLCVESINSRFAEIVALVERRRTELLDRVKHVSEEKRLALTNQLSLIETERDAVRQECDRLKGVLDVRSITKTINYLNEKLDAINGLTEPRENAFLRYDDCKPVTSSSLSKTGTHYTSTRRVLTLPSVGEDAMQLSQPFRDQSILLGSTISAQSDSKSLLDIAHCLAGFGRLMISTTYPALCTARLPSELVVHLHGNAIIQAVDYHGHPQSTSGTDPIEVTLTDPTGYSIPVDLIDSGDGSYRLNLLSHVHGRHKLSVHILNRSIRGSPFLLYVKPTQKRQWSVSEGMDGRGLIQPFAVTYGPYPDISEDTTMLDLIPTASRLSSASLDISNDDNTSNGVGDFDNNTNTVGISQSFIYVLDTGNSRMLVLDPVDGRLHATLTGEALSGQAATGMVWSPHGLWIVNWRAKQLFLLDPRTDRVSRCICSVKFKEPTSITRCPKTGRLFVADNAAGCVFVCDPITESIKPFIGSGKSKPLNKASLDQKTGSNIDLHSDPDCDNHFEMDSRLCKHITGLSISDNGELIISTGSSIRLYSSDGRYLKDLLLPVQLNEDPVKSRISSLPSNDLIDSTRYNGPVRCTSSNLRVASSRNNKITVNSGEISREPWTACRLSAPAELRHSVVSGSHYSNNSTSFSSSNAVRGQFGGVAFASVIKPNRTDYLGKCIVASYSDRKRSGVVVWPESCWRMSAHKFNTDSCLIADSKSATLATSCQPYLVEVDPGFRRLAGLVPLTTSRDMVVVDQGAQGVQRIRYA